MFPDHELPDALLDPAAYPRRPDTVELRETHISWVFLAGEHVYKVKKPVRYAFVDYGTVERRHAACRAELALNRRFATRIYRDVVALVPRAGGLAVAPEDTPGAVDYAVLMARYDEAATLAAQLAAGAVTAAAMERVGAAVAGFHADAPVDDDGLAAPVADVVGETLESLGESGAPARRLEALARFCRAALAGLDGELAARARAGRVRDGHGDLRAEHILPGEQVEAVDGLEFDPALRIGDVGYDLAFLVMDVARADGGLARALVRGYRAAGGDPGGGRLLAFFCALRALVRAKVDYLRAAQLEGAAARERVERALGLLGLAERFAWRARLPALVGVTGLPASGKSTVAEALAAAAEWPVLSSDRVRKARAGVDAYEPAGEAAYGDAESRAVYRELGRRAAAALERDGGAILDATFRRPADAEAFAAASPTAPAWLVCEAPPEVLLERAAARERAGGSVSDAGPAVVTAELARHPGPFRAPAPPLARLDTTRPVHALLDDLAAVLDARLAGTAAPR